LNRFLGTDSETNALQDEQPASTLDIPLANATPLIASCGMDGTMTYLPAPTPPPPQSAPKFKLVGVAEDNPINLKFLSKVLTSLGYKHVLCTNGEEMLTKFLEPESQIDVMILDMSMPVMDGLECSRLIRQTESKRAMPSQPDLSSPTTNTHVDGSADPSSNPPRPDLPTPPPSDPLLSISGLPIIALSGNALTEQVAEAFEAGISDYLLKPTKKLDLAKTLRYWEELVHAGKEHIPMGESARTIKKNLSSGTK
jgi:CheY-like chemotaxis protein